MSRGGSREWSGAGGCGRRYSRQYSRRKELWKVMYGARRDEEPARSLEHVLGGRGLVPLLPCLSQQS